ncbi:hypothetical protein SO802_005044 [Lithocarpus litseifolius]|uniref:PGG domain-containing protein n=1 Tax=Lithocarpus litseifolius TaxID=425828 RepID=A0AAW2DMM4_9ROSI
MELSHEGDDMIELYKAAGSGCMITLSRLREKNPYFLHRTSLTSFSETPLHISTLVGHLEFSKALLLLKPQLAGPVDSHNRCPLHLASAEGHIEITQALLHANNNACFICDKDGRIPLHYAVQRGRVDVVRELIAVQPNSTRVMVDGKETILHLCVKYDQLEVLKLLVESVSDEGEFLTSKDHKSGNTIFHLAVILKQIETIKYLLSVSKVKEEVDSLNYMGFTALQMLENCPKDFKSFTIRNILMDAGARVEKVNNLLPLSTIAAVQHESTNPSQLNNKRRKWLEYLNYRGDWIEEMRGALMVVATVITTITFQPAISPPPGGVWQTNVNEPSQGTQCNNTNPCEAGTSVFDSFRYQYFMVVNTISFTASLCAIFLLISGFPLKNKVCTGLMTSAMSIALIFLGYAYARAICLVNPGDSLLQANRIVMPTYVLIVMIAGVLLIHTIRFIVWLPREIRKFYKLQDETCKAFSQS